MSKRLHLGEIAVEVVLKNIKNIHLSVHPPLGQVRIAAPRRVSLETLRVFALSKLDWIRRQQRKLREQARETPREYLDRESHFVWGQRYLLAIEESDAAPTVELQPQQLVLRVRPGTDAARREAIMSAWYREQLRQAVPPLIARWEPIMGVKVRQFSIRRMKTRWGSCTPKTGRIRINTELAKKPRECLEYLIVHEMVHLLEPTHNARFKTLLDQFLPDWRRRKELLNQLPVRCEN
jgi:predicted metal-dependent hydrolase